MMSVRVVYVFPDINNVYAVLVAHYIFGLDNGTSE